MQLQPGTRLAHYEIVSLAGRGGMGEVYVARDGKLHRQVALKLLPEEFTRDADRLMRFDREARVLASLTHPHIASIFGLEEIDGSRFLVMELIEGDTLADRIALGAIPVEESIQIARQIAEGLEAAHEKGIVHRDLKPANIKVSDDDNVKILDFGLAKAMGAEDSAVDVTASPTMVKGSHTGMILGTAAYMSPEQARGKSVDRRTDVWAFGVVLWEMLTGKRPFDGETVTDSLIAIATEEPRWDELPANTPEALRRLLRRCLAKNPRERLHDIGDARLDLLEATQPAASSPAVAGAPAKASALRWLLPLLLLIVGAGAGFLIANARRTESAIPHVRGTINLPEGTQLAGWGSPSVAISPDGTMIAFAANRGLKQDLYIRRLDEFDAKLVEGSDGAEGPFFSPDGKWIAFGAGGISARSTEPRLLKKVPATGGAAQPICPLADYFGGTWGEDGFIYFANQAGTGLWRVRADGGMPEQLPHFRSNVESLYWPQFVRGLGVVAIRYVNGPEWEIVIIDPKSGSVSQMKQPATFARVAGERMLIFARVDGSLHAVPISVSSGQAEGTPAKIIPDLALTANGAAAFAVAQNGTAVWTQGYVRGSGRELRVPALVDPTGRVTPLDFEPAALSVGDVSPDRTHIAAASWDGEVWIYDLERNTRTKLPLDRSRSYSAPIWTPDGSSLVLNGESSGVMQLMIAPADGSGPARVLLPAERGEYWPGSFSPDGRLLAYFTVGTRPEQEGWEVWLLPLDDPKGNRKLADGLSPQFSPDGRWIAWESLESGTWEVYLQSFPEPTSRMVISRAGGKGATWSRDGRRLYFWDDNTMMAVDVKGPARSDIGLPVKVFDAPDLEYSLLRRITRLRETDGGYLAIAPLPGNGLQTQLKLAVDWLAEVDRTVAGQ